MCLLRVPLGELVFFSWSVAFVFGTLFKKNRTFGRYSCLKYLHDMVMEPCNHILFTLFDALTKFFLLKYWQLYMSDYTEINTSHRI